MRENNRSALWFISEVAGYSKIYIIFLLLVQMVLGISSVFYALLLRGLIDGAVAHDKAKMLTYCFLFVALVVGQIALRALLRFLEEFSKATYENAFKKWLFAGLLTHNYGAVTATHSGEWMNRLTSDTVDEPPDLGYGCGGRGTCNDCSRCCRNGDKDGRSTRGNPDHGATFRLYPCTGRNLYGASYLHLSQTAKEAA